MGEVVLLYYVYSNAVLRIAGFESLLSFLIRFSGKWVATSACTDFINAKEQTDMTLLIIKLETFNVKD